MLRSECKLISGAIPQFKFYDEGEHDAALFDYQKEVVSLDMLRAHADPFYNECRAYGRLREAGLDGKVAVRCHGYTTLPAAMESELEERFDVTDWERDDYDDPIEKRECFRAIVKDLIRDDVRLTHRLVKKMKKDLVQIRKLGIYPSDIKRTNYKKGILIDFSSAITEPNYYFDILRDSQVERLKKVDLIQFDKMIEDEKIKTWIRGTSTRNEEYCKKLRPRL